MIDHATGLIAPARQCASPNHDERPVDAQLELIVVHSISLPPNQFGGGNIEAFFCNQLDPGAHPYFRGIEGLRVSAHLVIGRDGHLTQFVPFHRRAWHAGASSFEGRDRCNDFSIGIELEGADDIPYESDQYASLNAVLAALRATYPSLGAAPVVGHADIAPGRKTDPGAAFDWSRVATPHTIDD
ncbi:MAG: 1,6-anhydro-N-acetylmuramyl-L-alanine amidase AmpD [Pseudomonadota bacterium]